MRLERGEKSEKTEETSKEQNADSLMAALKYRDRALERRKKYGSPEPPSPPSDYSIKLKIAKEQYEETANLQPMPFVEGNFKVIPFPRAELIVFQVAASSSVASKMMKKMGWSEGGGIGKNLQGISAPIEVKYFFFEVFVKNNLIT